MKHLKEVLVILLVAFSLISCSDTAPTKSNDNGIQFIAYQKTGCTSHIDFGKSTVFTDSCFIYSFIDTLSIEFCVPGNCCPDSNRFVTSYNIIADTIQVSVADTAENLCRCICNYIIHLDITGLPLNRYIFSCKYQNVGYNEILTKGNKQFFRN